MFTLIADGYNYPGAILTKPVNDKMFGGFEKDTEYRDLHLDLNNPSTEKCINITTQCRSIYYNKGLIYAHPQNYKVARHKVFRHQFSVLDYLEDNGYQVELTRLPSWNTRTEIPWFQFDLYSFFFVAEIMRIFIGQCRADVLSLIVDSDFSQKRKRNYGIEQGRRLRTFTKAGGKTFNWVEMPWVVTINEFIYRVRLCIYDTCAVHGLANYASFCRNSNVILPYKDTFSNSEKAQMDRMYVERPEDFDNYALGDLFNHAALLGNQDNYQKIYQTLGLAKYFTPPKLTIGATIARLVESAIKKVFDVDVNSKNDVINKFCRFGSADYLKRITQTTACLNTKVDGGRCRNNRPLEMYISGIICDIDISGCYGEGLRVQTYPLGIPFIIDYPVNSEINAYQTLGQFLKKYKSELAPGLWQARVSNKDGYILKHPQDYLVSWFPPSDMTNLRTDEDYAGTDNWFTIDNMGKTKILTNEVHHAIVTHDFVQWLDNVASTKQKRELLDNLIVETAIFYPASRRVNSVDELIAKHQEHKGVNTCEGDIDKKRARKIAISEECHYWYGINLGELIVNQLLLERKKHPKKTSFNEMYKLCVNTLYGDMVSPFFKVGNVVVGNNITARARALAWCMEKGFHGFQSITDGCAFDLTRVLFPRGNRRINGEMVVNLYTDKKLMQYKYAPLLNKDYLSVTDNIKLELEVFSKWKECDYGEELIQQPGLILHCGNELTRLSPEDSLKWVNRAAWKHLQDLFPGLDILHQPTTDVYGNSRVGQFQFEAKGFYDSLITHGTANYMLGYRGEWITKMRSYSKREQSTVSIEDELLLEVDGKKVAEEFLDGLKQSESVKRTPVYLKSKVLKCKDFKHDFSKWENTDVYPGMTIKSAGLLREFSLTQFTFQTSKQLQSWRREYDRFLRAYDQSYEMFFINEDDTLNYKLMIETIDRMIRTGKTCFFDGLTRSQVDKCRKMFGKHPESEKLIRTRNQLDIFYLGDCANPS